MHSSDAELCSREVWKTAQPEVRLILSFQFGCLWLNIEAPSTLKESLHNPQFNPSAGKPSIKNNKAT